MVAWPLVKFSRAYRVANLDTKLQMSVCRSSLDLRRIPLNDQLLGTVERVDNT